MHTVCRVTAPARLHLGFLDPDASSGRRYGGIGVALSDYDTVVHVGADNIDAAVADGISELMQTLARALGIPEGISIKVDGRPPRHAGFGSGTQLALAVGRAVTESVGQPMPTPRLARMLGRGRRSGLGIALFDSGGLVVDGGHGAGTTVPPPIARADVPDAWRVVLVLDKSSTGLAGRSETDAFSRLPPFPAARSAELCQLTLLGLLPAALEDDFERFAHCIGRIQAAIGDHFAPVQGGRFSSGAVGRVITETAARLGLQGFGQTSWGPTGFIFAPDAATAEAVAAEARRQAAALPALAVHCGRLLNHGAIVTDGGGAPVYSPAACGSDQGSG